jgi:NNP family nitrate/nitrite transporter-like MFS transporter
MSRELARSNGGARHLGRIAQITARGPRAVHRGRPVRPVLTPKLLTSLSARGAGSQTRASFAASARKAFCRAAWGTGRRTGLNATRKGQSMTTRNMTWISEWNPEDEKFWESKGKFIARRNLIWSILAEHLGFSIWLIWSIVATKLPQAGFTYTTDELFSLVALPGLIGSLMRFPYTFAVPRFGGRNWTMVSAALLFIPTVALAYFAGRPDTPFWLMLIVAASAGLGGGNFASSMANISFFYPDRMKGWALGLNAAGGNIGVSSVQFLTPILIGYGWVSLYLTQPYAETGLYLQNAGLMWLPLIALAVFGAYRYMNNLTAARSTFKTQFPEAGVGLAFLGPLVGSVARPLGGLFADKLGGARVTFWNFVAMSAATIGVMFYVDIKSFAGFLAMFLILFVTTGVGNGSTFRMIPSIFREEKLKEAKGAGNARLLAIKAAGIESAAVLGFTSAIGSLAQARV